MKTISPALKLPLMNSQKPCLLIHPHNMKATQNPDPNCHTTRYERFILSFSNQILV